MGSLKDILWIKYYQDKHSHLETKNVGRDGIGCSTVDRVPVVMCLYTPNLIHDAGALSQQKVHSSPNKMDNHGLVYHPFLGTNEDKYPTRSPT